VLAAVYGLYAVPVMCSNFELADLFPENAAPVKLLKFSPSGGRVATADVRRVVRVFEDGNEIFARRFRSIWDRLRALDHIRAIAFNSTGETLLVASGNHVTAVKLATGDQYTLSARKPHLAFMITCPQAITVSKQDEVAVAHDDGVIDIVQLNGPRPKPKSSWKDNDCPSFIGYLPDGERIVGTDRYSACVWDSALGTKLAKMSIDHVYAMAASPVDPVIALRHLRSVALWNIDTGEKLIEVAVRPGLPSIAFSRDGELFAIGDALGVSVFDRKGVERVRQVCGDKRVLALDFSPIDDTLAVGASDGSVSFLRAGIVTERSSL